MKRTLLVAIAIGVLVSSCLAADDRKGESEKEKDRQERREQVEKSREEMRQRAQQRREAERAQAEKAREQRLQAEEQFRKKLGKADQQQGEASKTTAEQQPTSDQPQSQPQPSNAQAYPYAAYSPPGPVFPPVPFYSLFNTPMWYGLGPVSGPFPNSGFQFGSGSQGTYGNLPAPPAPPVFGYQVMPPGFPVTVPNYSLPYAPYSAPGGAADESAGGR